MEPGHADKGGFSKLFSLLRRRAQRGLVHLIRLTTLVTAAGWLICSLMLLFDGSLLVNKRWALFPVELGFLVGVGVGLQGLWSRHRWRRACSAGVVSTSLAIGIWVCYALDRDFLSQPLPLWWPWLTFDRAAVLLAFGLFAGTALTAVECWPRRGRPPVWVDPAGAAQWKTADPAETPRRWLCDARGWRYFLRAVAAVVILAHGGFLEYLQFQPARWPADTQVARLWMVFAWTLVCGLLACLPWRVGRLMSHAVAVGTAGICGLGWMAVVTTWAPNDGWQDKLWLTVFVLLTLACFAAGSGVVALLRWEFIRNRPGQRAGAIPADTAADETEPTQPGWDQTV